MRLLRLTSVYPAYAHSFYAKRPTLAAASYATQLAALAEDASGGADFWSHALRSFGYTTAELFTNIKPLQQAWVQEELPTAERALSEHEVALAQVAAFQPDILWYVHSDDLLLAQIRALPHPPRLILGWVGSAIPRQRKWQQLDLMLSCAPESVTYFSQNGLPALHLNHGFDPRINRSLVARAPLIDLSFIGSIIRSTDFHLLREQILVKLVDALKIGIYSPSANYSARDQVKTVARATLQRTTRTLQRSHLLPPSLAKQPVIRRALQGTTAPFRLVHPHLQAALRPAVFGLEMFQTLCDSKINLNIHADSSPLYASNMRLFEATGVSACLLTDWRPNLQELFDIDREVVAYRSAEECVEKALWLLERPEERAKVAQAGQRRTLRDHTYQVRAAQLDQIIQSTLKARA